MKHLLRIEAPHFVAGAIWEGNYKDFKCIKAAPILHWMVGKSPLEVKSYLLKKKYSWMWMEIPNDN